MACCNSGDKLREEYENALRFEAVSYGRLIAHKRRHEETEEIPRVRHMRMVIAAAKAYAEGDAEALGEVSPDVVAKPE